jgi:hypothetical protein
MCPCHITPLLSTPDHHLRETFPLGNSLCNTLKQNFPVVMSDLKSEGSTALGLAFFQLKDEFYNEIVNNCIRSVPKETAFSSLSVKGYSQMRGIKKM